MAPSHPTTRANAEGAFAWDAPSTVPTVTDDATVGYAVTFTPKDTVDDNPVTVNVTLKIHKAAPVCNPPTANGGMETDAGYLYRHGQYAEDGR